MKKAWQKSVWCSWYQRQEVLKFCVQMKTNTVFGPWSVKFSPKIKYKKKQNVADDLLIHLLSWVNNLFFFFALGEGAKFKFVYR